MVALFVFLTSVYMLTYSGRLMYNDELQMFDVTGSVAEFGDRRFDVALWNVWHTSGHLTRYADEFYPFPPTPIEPGYSLLAAPVYWLAGLLPGVGLLHSVWLVNVALVAALALLLVRYSLLLGYSAGVGIAAALLLGLLTVFWPYTRVFMREPLLALLLLLTAYTLEQARRGRPAWLVIGVLAFAGAVLTKVEALVLLPALALIGAPPLLTGRRWGRLADALLVLALLVVVFLAYVDVLPALLGTGRIAIPGTSHQLIPAYFQTALHSYLISPNVSLWATSPALLLALPGAWLLIRADRRRYVWAMALAVLGFAVGHALVTGVHWFAGATLPPRFLLPTIPFVMLCTLPVIDRALHHRLAPPLLGALALLLIYSLWWQVTGAAFSWNVYVDHLPPESNRVTSWPPSLNRLEYLRPLVLTPVLFEKPLDFAWVRVGVAAWPLLFGGLALIAGLLLAQAGRGRADRLPPLVVALLPLALVALIGWGLHAIHADSEYQGDNDVLRATWSALETEAVPGDVLLVSGRSYETFFYNHASSRMVRVAILPDPPGERGSFEQIPDVVSDDVVDLLPPYTPQVIAALAAQRDRLWLLMDSGPFIPWSLRPLERYLSKHYYPLRVLETTPGDPRVRLLEYSATLAPDRAAPPSLPLTPPVGFGEVIQLDGLTLPAGTVYAPGAALPVTLHWSARAQVEADYIVGLFLAHADGSNVVFVDGVLVQGYDTPPVGGFSPTSRWTVSETVADNRALRLPGNLPPGAYRLAVTMYTFTPDDAIITLPVDGDTVLSDDIALLPVIIEVAPTS